MIEIEGSGNVCENMEDALGVLNRMKDPTVKVVVYDTETNGLDHRNGYIVGHVITLGPSWQQNFYVPVRHGEPREGNILDEFQDKIFWHPFEMELNEIWNTRRDLLIVGHNLQFDLRFLFRHNITTKSKLEDTQVNAALLNEHLGRFSLDSIARLMGAREKRGEPLYRYLASKFGCEADRNSMAHFWKLSGRDRQGCDYALGDGLSTWDVWEAQQSALASQDLTDIHALEKRVTRAVYRMYMRGVRVDRGRMDEVSSIVQTLLDEARKALPDDFNPRSSTQMRKLMEANGHTDWPLTEKGNPQFNEAFLKKYPIGQAVIRVRKYSNLENSFITPLRERHVWGDDRVRAIYYQMASDDFGTVTGRFSCTEPNMQQVPKRNVELGKLVRSIFVPDEGHLWYSADLAQCEPRLLAHYSETPVLVNGYTKKPFVDCHSSVANSANIERQDGKVLNQTLITGGGRKAIIEQLGARGGELYDRYFETMPEIKVLQKTASRRMEQRGYVRSYLGRRARLERRDKSYTAINRLLQCGNADICKEVLVRMDEYFESEGDVVGVLDTIHDAFDLSAPDDPKGEEIAMNGLRMMADYGPGRRRELVVPMAADYATGSTWAEASYPDKGSKKILGEDPDDESFKVHA